MPLDPATVAHRWFEEAWNQGSERAIDELSADNVIGHGLGEAGNDVVGRDHFRVFWRISALRSPTSMSPSKTPSRRAKRSNPHRPRSHPSRRRSGRACEQCARENLRHHHRSRRQRPDRRSLEQLGSVRAPPANQRHSSAEACRSLPLRPNLNVP